MLEELHVRDLALIEEVWLEFGPGMTVLTGETGAGKTALVGALKLLVGERADSSMVRAGSTEAVVEGRFRLADREVLARRRIGADGRSKCTLDGEMATVRELADTLGPALDLHGQHDHQALLSPSLHVRYLDRYAGPQAEEALRRYREARDTHAESVAALQALDSALDDAERRLDYLRFVDNEISSARLTEGEDEELERRMPALRHGEKLASAAAESYGLLHEDGGVSDAIASARAALARVSGLDPALDALAEQLAEVSAVADEVAGALRAYGDGIEHDPAAVDAAESRLAAIVALKRKYGGTLADVLATAEDARGQIDRLESRDDERAAAELNVAQADAALGEAAAELARVREAVAPLFGEAVEMALGDLAMMGASVQVSITPLEREQWTADGPHRVEFMFVSGAGQLPRPLAKIASGGEISRVMLALKGVLGAADDVPVLVFDEVDAGIGGNAASAVGRRLAALSTDHQVLVVTHLAQVAAFADHHLAVEKSSDAHTVRTTVRPVSDEELVAEIARMLSGEDTDTAKAHAQELLAKAAAGVSL